MMESIRPTRFSPTAVRWIWFSLGIVSILAGLIMLIVGPRRVAALALFGGVAGIASAWTFRAPRGSDREFD